MAKTLTKAEIEADAKALASRIEADVNALTSRICIKIWGNDYDDKITPKLFNDIKELVESKLS